MEERLKNAADTVCAFLARRDIHALSREELGKKGIERFDVAMVFGSDMLEVISCAADAYKNGLCKKLLFSGGIGHGTSGLRKNVKERYGMDTDEMAEGDIMAAVAIHVLGVPEGGVLIENKSTNSGENAVFSLRLMDKTGLGHDTILLLQDPFMQLRSHLTLQPHLDEGDVLVSFAPLVPGAWEWEEQKHWSRERFKDLLLREIPRVRDDENGYGPKGMGFIAHCEIPRDVLDSYAVLVEALGVGNAKK